MMPLIWVAEYMHAWLATLALCTIVCSWCQDNVVIAELLILDQLVCRTMEKTTRAAQFCRTT